jgi:hypothetical protein
MASRPREKGLVQTEVTPTIVAGVCDPGIPTATGLTEAGYNACPIVARAEAPGCYPKTSVFEPCREKRQKAPESATPGEPNLEPQTQSHHCFALTLASFRAMCPDGNSFPNVHTLLSAGEIQRTRKVVCDREATTTDPGQFCSSRSQLAEPATSAAGTSVGVVEHYGCFGRLMTEFAGSWRSPSAAIVR